jgi:hypothetical protein
MDAYFFNGILHGINMWIQAAIDTNLLFPIIIILIAAIILKAITHKLRK